MLSKGYVVSDVTLSEEFVEAYLKTLKNHTNKYKLEQLNREHYFQTTKRFAAVRSALQDKNCPAFFEGFQILFLPTPLIANSIPYAMLYELTWDQKNSGKTSMEVLDMYSSDMAARMYNDLPEIQELAIFWTVPYLNNGTGKISFERKDNGMAYTDKIFDSNFN